MTGSLWNDLVRQGPASLRPSTPDFPGAKGFYYSTDSAALDLWIGDSWYGVSGGAPSSYPQVATWADLPTATGSGDIYVVQTTTGIPLVNRKPAGLWHDAPSVVWNYLGNGITASDVVNTPAGTISSASVQAAIEELDGDLTAHKSEGAFQHPAATTSIAGFMTGADKTKLDGIAAGATANASDASLRDRSTHTGTQAASTISDFDTAADARIAAATGVSVAAISHTHPAVAINDSTTAGRAMLTAADVAAQTALLNAFTSGLKGLVPPSGGGTSNFLRADGTWAAPSGGAGGVNSGTTTVNFGAFPGASDAKTVVTGQAGILAGSKVKAYIMATATADHTADEHWVETLEVMAGNIVPGTGFDIYAKNAGTLSEPVAEQWAVTRLAGPGTGANQVRPDIGGGKGTRLYGQFTVAWEWI